MSINNSEYMMSAEELFCAEELMPPQGAINDSAQKVQDGYEDAEIGLVMEIKGVTREQAVKILDERIAKLRAQREGARENGSRA